MPRIIKIKCFSGSVREYKECHGPALFGLVFLTFRVRSTLWLQRPPLPVLLLSYFHVLLCVWLSVCCSRGSLAPVEYPSPEVCLFTFFSMSSSCVSCFILIVPGSVCVTLGFGFLGSLVDCVPQVFSLRPYLISGFLCSLSCPYTQAVLCVLLFLLFPVRFMPEFWVSCILKLLFQGCCWVVAQQPRITSMTISAFELVYLWCASSIHL